MEYIISSSLHSGLKTLSLVPYLDGSLLEGRLETEWRTIMIMSMRLYRLVLRHHYRQLNGQNINQGQLQFSRGWTYYSVVDLNSKTLDFTETFYTTTRATSNLMTALPSEVQPTPPIPKFQKYLHIASLKNF